MSSKEIIEALKVNEKPFGLMTEEMQAKANKIGSVEFEKYAYNGLWLRIGTLGDISEQATYRLRADYAEDSGVVECEVQENRHGLHYVDSEGRNLGIGMAVNHPDFIGFDCDGMLWGRLYKWTQDGSFHTVIRRDRIDQYEVCDMSEAKVLFKGVTK